MNRPRKLKKGVKNAILSLDAAAIPDGLDFGTWMRIYRETGLAIYDSTMGNPPNFLHGKTKKLKIKDVSKEQVI